MRLENPAADPLTERDRNFVFFKPLSVAVVS